jgi:hypothetical protein
MDIFASVTAVGWIATVLLAWATCAALALLDGPPHDGTGR